ncbi:MAG: hypothetical protein QXD51_01640 [Candidatus Anstonellales archaeon]
MFVFQVRMANLPNLSQEISKQIRDRASREGFFNTDGSLAKTVAYFQNKKYKEYRFRFRSSPWLALVIDGKELEYCPITTKGFQWITDTAVGWWNATLDDVKRVSEILFGDERWGVYFYDGILKNGPEDLPSPQEIYNYYISKGCSPGGAAGYAAHVNPSALAIQLLINCAVEMAIGFGEKTQYPQKKLMYGFVNVLGKDAYGNQPNRKARDFAINSDFLNALNSIQASIKNEYESRTTSKPPGFLSPLVEMARNAYKNKENKPFSREQVKAILREKGWKDDEIESYLSDVEKEFGSFNYDEWKELYDSFYSQFYSLLDPEAISDPESVLLWMNPYYGALFYAAQNNYNYNNTKNMIKYVHLVFPDQSQQEKLFKKMLEPYRGELYARKSELDKIAVGVSKEESEGSITVTAFDTQYTVKREGIYKIDDSRYFLVVRGAEGYGVKELDLSHLGEPEIKLIDDYKTQLKNYKDLLNLIEEFLNTGEVNPAAVERAVNGAGSVVPNLIRDLAKYIIENGGKATRDFWKRYNIGSLLKKIREEREWVDSQLSLISSIDRIVYMNLYVQSVQEFSTSDEFYNEDEHGRILLFFKASGSFFTYFDDFLKAGGAQEISERFWGKYFKSSQSLIPIAITNNNPVYSQRALRTYGEDLKKFYTDFYKLVAIKRTAWSINFFLSLDPNKPSTFAVQLNEKTWLTPTEIRAAGFMGQLSPFIIKNRKGFKVSKDLLCAFIFFGLMRFEDGGFELTKRGEELLKEWAKEKNLSSKEQSYIKYEISSGIMSDYGLDFLVFLKNRIVEKYAEEENIPKEEAIKQINEKNTQILSTSLDLLGKFSPLLPAINEYTNTQVRMLVIWNDPHLSANYLQILNQLDRFERLT